MVFNEVLRIGRLRARDEYIHVEYEYEAIFFNLMVPFQMTLKASGYSTKTMVNTNGDRGDIPTSTPAN